MNKRITDVASCHGSTKARLTTWLEVELYEIIVARTKTDHVIVTNRKPFYKPALGHVDGDSAMKLAVVDCVLSIFRLIRHEGCQSVPPHDLTRHVRCSHLRSAATEAKIKTCGSRNHNISRKQKISCKHKISSKHKISRAHTTQNKSHKHNINRMRSRPIKFDIDRTT